MAKNKEHENVCHEHKTKQAWKSRFIVGHSAIEQIFPEMAIPKGHLEWGTWNAVQR